MLRSFCRVVWVALPLLLVACGKSSAPESTPAAGSDAPMPPCDVTTALARCQECHGEKPIGGAPMSLVTRADLMRDSISDPSSLVVTLVRERMRDPDRPMPPAPRPRATFSEVAAIERWMDALMPARAPGEQCSAGAAGAGGAASQPCTPNVTLAPPSPWTMPAETDDIYVCYGVEVPGSDAKRHVTGIVPTIDDARIVHHLLVFESDKPEPATPHKCKQLFPVNWKAIYAWGPGAPPYQLPAAAGFPLPAGGDSHLVVQVHYSNLPHEAGHKDATSVGLCVTDKLREYDADILWVGGFDFLIPPHSTATVSCKLKLDQSSANVLPIQVFQAWPHMHQLGRKLTSTVQRPDGSTASLGTADPYVFGDQVTYPVDATLALGDTIETRCTWKNDGAESVSWGEATSEEMCFNLLAYYPKIPLPQFNGPATSYLSTCTMQK